MTIPKQIKSAKSRYHLTERETQTLALLAQGEPWKSIAEILTISIETVRFHASNVCRKMNAPTCISAVGKIALQ